MEKNNRTLLYSGDTVSACDLSEPVTNFEYFEIDKNTRGCFFPSTASLNQAKTTEVGYWQNDGYLDKQEMFKLTNNGQHLEAINFQYLYQTSSNNLKLLGSAINRANNIKFFSRVYGCNRISGTETSAEGMKPSGEGWKTYNETLLTDEDAFGKSAIPLSEPARGFERVKVLVGSYGESPNIYEYAAPWGEGENFTTHSYWGASTGSNYLNWARWQWKDGTSTLSAYNGGLGKSYQLGFNSGANNSLTALNGYNGDENWVRRNIRKVWGINRRPIHTLTILPSEHGSAEASVLSGWEHDQVTITDTPDEGWYFDSIDVTGATVNGKTITFQDQDASARVVFTDNPIYTLTLQNDGHGTIAATKTTGHSGDTVTLSNNHADYYRFNNYTVTGGTINGSTYTFGMSNGTAKANFTANKFTITGNYNYGQVTYTASWDAKVRAITGKDVPTSWGTVGNNFNPGSCSAYGFTYKTKVNGWYERGSSKLQLYHYIGSTRTKSAGVEGYNGYNNYTNSCTLTGTSTLAGHPKLSAWISCSYSKHTNGMPTNGWTATGYIK